MLKRTILSIFSILRTIINSLLGHKHFVIMTLNIKMQRSHPGSVIKDWFLPEDMSITKAAKKLGVSRQSLDALVNERKSVTPEMALRLEAVFGGTARLFLALQASYDLYQAEKRRDQITGNLKPYSEHPNLKKPHAA